MNFFGELNSSTILAVIFGMLILLLFLVLAIVIFRAVLRKPSSGPPLVPADDGKFEIVGKRVSCSHCHGTSFVAQEILLNTWLLSLLRIDWLDSSATVLSCKKCGQLIWFSADN
jgi:predicted nucleic-acid-binding Zn-ribbon protein